MNPRHGDLLFFRHRSLLGSVIRGAQTILHQRPSRYSHVAVCLWERNGGAIIHDVLDPVAIHPWTDYVDDVRSGKTEIHLYRPTEGSHADGVEALVEAYPPGTPYGVGRLLLGLFPTSRPTCASAARLYLEARFGRTMPALDWRRRAAGERRPDHGFATVDGLVLAQEQDGKPWLDYCGELALSERYALA